MESAFCSLDEIDRQPAIKALERLYSSGRFPHAILFVADNLSFADEVVKIFANKILNCDSCEQHLDFFQIGPNASSSQITTEEIHGLILNIQSSPKVAAGKVVHIACADAMNK